MRIGIDIQCLRAPLTGVGYYTLGLLKGLASLPLEDEICPFYFSCGGEMDLPPQIYKKLTLVGKRIPGRLLSWGWNHLRFPPLNWLIPGMDLYHFPNFVARPVRQKPVCTTIYDLSFKRYPEFIEPKNLRFLQRFVPPGLERSDRIIVISEFTKRELLSLVPVPEGKVSVVYGGVDDVFRQLLTPDEIMRVRYQYNLPEKYVLTVATWEPRKNLGGLLKAWTDLKESERVGDYRLVVAGMKGWLYHDLERQFQDRKGAGGVMPLGYVRRSNLPAVYQGAALFVFPSFYEGQGLPPMEAQASGVPVAASRAASLPEVLGEGALYFDPDNPREIAQAINNLLREPALRARLKKAGLKQSRNFTWERAAEQTLSAYREACGRI